MKIHCIGFAAALALGACATAPQTTREQDNLAAKAAVALDSMTMQSPALDRQLQNAYGYVVFPDIGKGGAIVGGAFGRGIVYENGRRVGFAELAQASLGAQLGAQSFSQIIVFQNRMAMDRFKRGGLTFGGDASVVVLKAGAGASAAFRDGVAVYIAPQAGLMVDLSIKGQEVDYAPVDRDRG